MWFSRQDEGPAILLETQSDLPTDGGVVAPATALLDWLVAKFQEIPQELQHTVRLSVGGHLAGPTAALQYLRPVTPEEIRQQGAFAATCRRNERTQQRQRLLELQGQYDVYGDGH